MADTQSSAPATSSTASRPSGMTHAFSVDVEDWFHILECDEAPDPAAWKKMESRVERSTTVLLDLLDKHHHTGTFFILGWVAEHHPDLVREIARRGHEIGSHSHLHGLVSAAKPADFARDLERSLKALRAASGSEIRCFRAPGFSIGPDQAWAFDVLADHGITLDSSLFLSARAHGGFPLDRLRPFDIVLPDGRRILEAPVVPLRLPKVSLPWAGGGYLRLLPKAALLGLMAQAEHAERPVVTYVHPREVDPAQPRMDLPLRRRFKYYVGLNTVIDKLDSLFAAHRFGTISDVATRGLKDPPLLVRRAS
ncbi:MAG: polysaccharide deacetylase family protein [Myxococcales bacterium]|nr:polysaccharide deacetylase family protein [Myxococcales bacterium]